MNPQSLPLHASHRSPAAGPRHRLWDALRQHYLRHREPIASTRTDANGELPALLVGDVRRIVARWDWLLSAERFDRSGLASVRAAWKQTAERLQAGWRGRAWWQAWPDSVAFWCDDTLPLANALGAVDARRDAMGEVEGLPEPGIAYADPRILWSDLRHWWAARRAVRRDPATGLRYPDTTVRDVRHAAALVDARGDRGLVKTVAEASEGRADSDVYPYNAAFWCTLPAGVS